MNTKNINAATILDSLNPVNIPVLEDHFRTKILAEINSALTSKLSPEATQVSDTPEAPVVPTAPGEKRGRGRPRKNPDAKVEAPAAKRNPGRPKKDKEVARATSKDGRSVSQVIRDHYKKHPEAPVADAIAYVEKQGLSCSAPLVYAVRKKMDLAAAEAEKAAKKAERAAEKEKAEKKAAKDGKTSKKTTKK